MLFYTLELYYANVVWATNTWIRLLYIIYIYIYKWCDMGVINGVNNIIIFFKKKNKINVTCTVKCTLPKKYLLT
jgi:hypothetical protein